ncbi:MAG TPA: hypothetical protein VGM88_30310 [Kofleriaceae bacterium]|jgi:hypothetical protein
MRHAVLAIAMLGATAAPAHAYEFWLTAQTTGQAYQEREVHLIGPDVFFDRRRFTQTLALRIWDVGDLEGSRRRSHLPAHGLRISWLSYVRVNHDFGAWVNGKEVLPGNTLRRFDAIDVTPELADDVASLDLMYGYLQLDGLFDDRLQVQVGRTLADDGWSTTAIDGVAAKVELPDLPVPLTVAASVGLRVRAASPLGTSQYELDGTSGAGCEEYVEGATPGTGAWKLIDRNRMIENTALTSDYAYCPQRDEWQPTISATISTIRYHGWGVELGYRRTSSDTVGVIDGVNRLQYPDLGLYPNEYGQAPGTGVNEERLYARVTGDIRTEDVRIAPYADLRYSLLDGLVDRADLGVRLRDGAHSLEPSVEYFYPTFDGDSIFNAFALDPTLDARLAYTYDGPVHATASAWLRKYLDETATGSTVAGGFDAGVAHALAHDWTGKLDGLFDTGYGGRRAGGTADVAWRQSRDLSLGGRAILLAVRPDDGTPRYVTTSTMLRGTYRVADSVAVHAIAQEDYDAIQSLQLRAMLVLDLAFAPEP